METEHLMIGLEQTQIGKGRGRLSSLAAFLVAGTGIAPVSGASQALAGTGFTDGQKLIVSQAIPDPAPLPPGFSSGDNLFVHGFATVGFTFSANGVTIIDGSPGTTGEPLHAGQFTMSVTDASNHTSTVEVFCGDIFDFLSLPDTYTVHVLDPASKL